MTTTDEAAALVERLREMCVDWDGTEMHGDCEPRIWLPCKFMRGTATTIEALTTERDRLLASQERAIADAVERCAKVVENEGLVWSGLREGVIIQRIADAIREGTEHG